MQHRTRRLLRTGLALGLGAGLAYFLDLRAGAARRARALGTLRATWRRLVEQAPPAMRGLPARIRLGSSAPATHVPEEQPDHSPPPAPDGSQAPAASGTERSE
ncbi:MAG TPA: hypothetical protein VKV23_06935 [Acidimicrobiales bacterium]|nr:hypothetical protein [Acidimicrobiales bacterium]